MLHENYEKNVFINCPFDEAYKGLFYAIVFVVTVLGFIPRTALESFDSGENRIDKIVLLISQSKYGIHDLSRLISSEKDEIFRLNMPLELGIDLGCKKLIEEHSEKKLLVLEKERYRFQKAISDLSGIDIKAHNENGATLVECIRDWFAGTVGLREIPSPKRLINDYTDDFQVYLLEKAENLGYSKTNYINEMILTDYQYYINCWCKEHEYYCRFRA